MKEPLENFRWAKYVPENPRGAIVTVIVLSTPGDKVYFQYMSWVHKVPAARVFRFRPMIGYRVRISKYAIDNPIWEVIEILESGMYKLRNTETGEVIVQPESTLYMIAAELVPGEKEVHERLRKMFT